MSITKLSGALAVALTLAGFAGATSSAFADEYVSQENREQYAINERDYAAAHGGGAQALLPANAGATSNPGHAARPVGVAPATPAAPLNGPVFSDKDAHWGPSHSGSPALF